jgi:hypothetical protein|nr:MAG TPA: hypothetical protein [Caudoviricetes sp.]
MTKEYIERGALIARYDAEHVGPPGRARELIATAPAVDVVPVVHGEPTEHLRELLRAEKDGRLVVLPCKIGATVYRFQRYFNDATLKSEIKIKPCVVESVSTKCIITTDHMVMLFSNFGKTVFLTREEAEKALEGYNGQKR